MVKIIKIKIKIKRKARKSARSALSSLEMVEERVKTGMLFSIFAWFTCLLFTAVIGPFALFLSLFLGEGVLVYLTKVWAKTICYICGVTVETRGKENISSDGCQIFVSNHQGIFDIFFFCGFIDVPFIWIAKESLFKIPIIGWALKRSGHIPINRSKPKESLKSLLKAVEYIKKGRSIVIFPEGTRTRDGSLGKFKKGSLYIVSKTNVPIVPITINGSYNVIKKNELIVHPGKMKIVIGEKINTENYNRENETKLLEEIKLIIEGNLDITRVGS